ncbi:Terpene synthase metal-binding domain protein-like protein [Leptotrombidium deliense]|uniref:Terpene synthase n=1 Tax=Leptotrombidium deliense TaxID=299467 RepID=A0A443SA53_9ACAR|nr:Terpene synthase metal-binding domain protein-like protein [Leptotrombidium deliense]
MISRNYIYPSINIENFEASFHPDYEKINDEVSQWVIKNNLPVFSNDSKKYVRENAVTLACMCYPHGDYDRTCVIAKFIVHLFLLDDIIESKTPNKFYDSLVNHGNENKDVINALDKCFEDQTPLVVAFAEIWGGLKSFTNTTWQTRWAENYICYLKVQKWDLNNVMSKRVASLIEYIEYRHYSGAMDAVFDLIEFSLNIFLPDRVVGNITLRRLTFTAAAVVCYVNDIHSFEKEKLLGQVNNLVNVMQHEYNISAQEAINKATEFVNKEIEKFFVLEKMLPNFEGDIDDNVKKYSNACKHWMRSNYDWGFKTRRYTVQGYKL